MLKLEHVEQTKYLLKRKMIILNQHQEQCTCRTVGEFVVLAQHNLVGRPRNKKIFCKTYASET